MDKTCGTCERCDNKVSSQHLICQQCYDDDAAYDCEACDKTFDVEVSTMTYWRCTPKEPPHAG